MNSGRLLSNPAARGQVAPPNANLYALSTHN